MTTPAWLDVPPWEDVTPPLTVGSTERSADMLEHAVAQFLLDVPGRYSPRDVSGDTIAETFCNVFASDATAAMGCRLPRQGYLGGALKEWRVQEQRTWLATRGDAHHGWERLSDGHVAQAMADAGQVAVAIWCGPTAARGHIAVLVPSRGAPGVWIAQAGRSCFSRGLLSRGFGTLPVEYWGHP